MHSVEDILTPEEHDSLYGRRRDLALLKLIMKNVTSCKEEALELIKYRYTSFECKEVDGHQEINASQPESIDYYTKELAVHFGTFVNDFEGTLGLIYCAEHLGRLYGKVYSETFLYNAGGMLDLLDKRGCKVLKEGFIDDLRSVNRLVKSCAENGKNWVTKRMLDDKIVDIAVDVEKSTLTDVQSPY